MGREFIAELILDMCAMSFAIFGFSIYMLVGTMIADFVSAEIFFPVTGMSILSAIVFLLLYDITTKPNERT